MVLPFVEVSHLPSSTSFFAAVLHPLGLEYLHAGRDDPPSAATFGASGDPVLQIRQALVPRLSSLVLTAPSRLAVIRFQDYGLRSNPPPLPCSQDPGLRGTKEDDLEEAGVAGVRVALLDLDGNRIEVVHPDPEFSQDAVRYNGSTARRPHSSTEQVGRVLKWKYDVNSAAPSAAASTTTTAEDLSRSRVIPRTRISSKSLKPPMSASPRQSASSDSSSNSGGLSASTLVGALLGVAAGAALTYGIVSRDKDRAPRHDVDFHVSGTLPRSETFPEPPPPEDGKSMYQRDHDEKLTAVLDKVPRRIAVSYSDKDGLYTRDHVYGYNRSRGHDLGDRLPQRCLTQGSHHSIASQGVAIKDAARSNFPRSRTVDDSHGAHSPRSTKADGPRSRSEAPLPRAPFPATGLEKRSHARAPSRYSDAPKSSYSTRRGTIQPAYETGPSTYISARSHRTATVLRPSGSRPEYQVPGETQLSDKSRIPTARAGSKATSCLSARHIPLPDSQAPSSVSARDVPLPASGVGSFASWDDDLDSVVPSDSISCVGSQAGSGRRRHRHRY